MRLPAPPLLLITDRRQARRPLAEIIEAACAAGCRWISLREKDLPQDEQIALFASLRPIFRKWSARATIHRSIEVAKSAAADGVHLAAGSDPISARAALGAEAFIGLSVHGPGEAKKLPPGVVDYVIAGPVFETASKPGYGPGLGASGITAIAAVSNVPVIAIGGIGPAHAWEIMTAGAAGVAVMGAVMRSHEPRREMEGLLDAIMPRSAAVE